MYYDKIPTYEEIKQFKEETKIILFSPLVGGYFRLTINEENNKNIALDYLDNGLEYINFKFKSEYKFSHLYKLNKKNYIGLIKLYKQMLNKFKKDIIEAIEIADKIEI